MSSSWKLFAEDTVNPAQPKQSSFQVRNAFTVQVPKGSKTVRLWFAVPQEDATSVVRELITETSLPGGRAIL
jgi:hypothetical protein